MRTKTGSWLFDTFTNGYWGITAIIGEPGAGVSTVFMTAAQANINDKVFWIDTNHSFSIDRFKQLGKADLNKLFIIKPKDKQGLTDAIQKVSKLKMGLLIIDSLTSFYRLEVKSDRRAADIELDKQLKLLKPISLQTCPVLLSADAYFNIDTEQIVMIGGDLLKYYSNTVLQIYKMKHASKAVMIKPGKKQIVFKITERGIEPYGGSN
jgi:hypothetical protein